MATPRYWLPRLFLSLWAIAAYAAPVNSPNGYNTVAYLDCGAAREASEVSAARIRQISGETLTFPGVEGPLGTAAMDPRQLEFEVSGLEPVAQYVLAFTWWDVDKLGRRQSVYLRLDDGVRVPLLRDALAAAFHKGESTWSQVLLPLPAEYVRTGSVSLEFAREAGPNVVVQELWVLKKADNVARKRVLIVTGDDYPGHLWRETGPELANILRQDPRLEVSITETPAIYGSPLMAQYDATVLHFKDYAERLPFDAQAWSGLQNHVEGGGGLIIVHFGCGAFQEWPGFEEVAGRVWDPQLRAHDPYGPFTVRMSDPAHAITAGMQDFPTEDELYTCLKGAKPISVLCDAVSKVDQKPYPMAFVHTLGAGRIFHCTLGHDHNAFLQDGARTLYRRAVAWAVGLAPD
ncbi:MAG: ThuA domain-containing protein [Candidatus Hydrogenedentes bacterium]|nr:ThuA domain-containing protein [Candidatus Hydrogenedentota bacterium]MBI3117105.1 ThuA domain-containing protein [Candidatus Hydrogenedentota bacterium]